MRPPLTWIDAWFLAALTDARSDADPRELWEFVNNADWLYRGIPTFEEVRFSLPRLEAAGLLLVGRAPNGGLTLKATEAAFELRARVTADTLGGVLLEMAEVVGAPAYPAADDENRSLGPLEGFEESDWDSAVTRNADWMTEAVSRLDERYRPKGAPSG
ncbi:MAG: hypothetical protein L0227_12575 [Chloroflexi bacterium]|nr:hypothetical protein [Chloroflexota bacterium]